MSENEYCQPVTHEHLQNLIARAQALAINDAAKAFIVNHLTVCGQGEQICNTVGETPTGWPHNYWHDGLLCTGMGWDEHAFEFGKLMNDAYLKDYTDYHVWRRAGEDVFFDANDSTIKIWDQFFCE